MTGAEAMTRADVQAAALRIARDAGAEVLLDEPLAPYLSMRVGGPVAALLRPASTEDVVDVVRALRAEAVPHRLLGGGSNLLVTDTGLDFAVVHLAAAGTKAEWQEDVAGEDATVRAPAGMTLAALLRDATQRGRSGLEWAAGLPGTIGGAVTGNAGAFGGEVGRSVVSARLLELVPGGARLREHVVEPGDFAYRRSFVRRGEVVLDVTLRLAASTPVAVRAEADRVNRARAASQPKGGHSSGCIFRNPPGDAAGRLVDRCGLKGRRRGGAMVSPVHGNFIVNDGTATADDIVALVDEVRAEVLRQTGVTLELEVVVWRGVEGALP